MPAVAPRAGSRLGLGAVGLALGLRLLRGLVRWDEVAWQYASYPAATVDALEAGELGAALTTFTGLHPPLWPLLHALGERWLPVPALAIGLSVGAGVGAVALLARRWPWAALVLATAPAAVQYGAEVNQYPLLVLILAGLFAARAAGRAPLVVLLAAAAAWTHALGAVVGVVVVASLPPPARRWGLGALALAGLPLVPGVLARLGSDTTFAQPPWKPGLVATELVGRLGALGLVALPLAARGGGGGPLGRVAAAAVGALGAVLAVLLAFGVAAPHQFAYLSVFAVPWAILVGHGRAAAGRWTRAAGGLLLGLALVQGAWQAGFDLWRLRTIATDPPRAIDVALAEATRPWRCGDRAAPDCSGDAVVLLSPPGPNDDDKGLHSPVLWRIRPWWPLPRVRPYTVDGRPLDHGDHRHGQPRLVQGRVVYVHDWPRPTLEAVVAAHERVWVVVYEAGARTALTTGLADRLGARAERVGPDWLLRVEGRAGDGLSGR